MHISLFSYHYSFISSSVLSQPLSRPQIEPNQSYSIKQMPETRINTGFRHFNPLFKLGKLLFYIKLFCLSFAAKMSIFYFYYIFYFGLLIFCCQSVATNILYQIKQIKQHILPINNQFTDFAFYHPNHIFCVV